MSSGEADRCAAFCTVTTSRRCSLLAVQGKTSCSPVPFAVYSQAYTCRLSQLAVRHTAEQSCWVALPAGLIARLLQAQAPLPLVLELRPAAPPGAAPPCR